MQFFLMFFATSSLVFVIIAIHELGHFLAGLMAGIPASVMRIRLFTFPQHVALRDGNLWLSPVANFERYVAVSRPYLTTRAAAFQWVAGGMVLETLFTVVVSVTAMSCGWILLSFWIVAMSLSVYLINVFLMDIPWAVIRGHAFGDTSGLWMIAKFPTALLTILMIALRILLLWIATPMN